MSPAYSRVPKNKSILLYDISQIWLNRLLVDRHSISIFKHWLKTLSPPSVVMEMAVSLRHQGTSMCTTPIPDRPGRKCTQNVWKYCVEEQEESARIENARLHDPGRMHWTFFFLWRRCWEDVGKTFLDDHVLILRDWVAPTVRVAKIWLLN